MRSAYITFCLIVHKVVTLDFNDESIANKSPFSKEMSIDDLLLSMTLPPNLPKLSLIEDMMEKANTERMDIPKEFKPQLEFKPKPPAIPDFKGSKAKFKTSRRKLPRKPAMQKYPMFNIQKPPALRTDTSMNTPKIPNLENKSKGGCCDTVTCYPICPYQALPLPTYQMPSPIVVPAHSYFEPVIHDHPPLEDIRKILNKENRKKKKQFSCSYEYSDSSDTDYSSDTY